MRLSHLQTQALRRFGITLGQGDIIKIHNYILKNKKGSYVRDTWRYGSKVHRVSWAGELMYFICDKRTLFPMTVLTCREEFGGRLSRRL